ncbi:hypothetical protein CEXT_35701 [Caerostris extrusa]|uniref:Uncharacterized protein n=1 Tax=Caerostris extrusa TaxID=172846 RepID=A0AAV4NZI1_CAEEX|nr:hypothetical protein CEXT_35701 [Caerostris extrusa]
MLGFFFTGGGHDDAFFFRWNRKELLGREAADFGGGSHSSSDAISTAARRRNRRPSDVAGRTSQFLFPLPSLTPLRRRNVAPSAGGMRRHPGFLGVCQQ